MITRECWYYSNENVLSY